MSIITPTDPDDLPPPPDDHLIIDIESTGAATHVDCGGDVAVLTADKSKVSCDKCKLVVGVECVVPREIAEAEQPPGPLKFHYGDGTIIDAGTMIHDDCGGIISIIEDGLVCECGTNSDMPAPTPNEETLQPFRDALARDAEITKAMEVAIAETGAEVVGFLAATCAERHVPNCECRGVARGPRP
jgi:hypothetical protein